MKHSLLAALFAIASAGAGAAQPDRFDEFQSARINQTYAPIFPEQLVPRYRNGGRVRVLVSVNREGRLEEWLVISYTAREFADSALAALRHWEFEPARLRGEPVDVCIELQFTFEVKGCVVSISPADYVAGAFSSIFDQEEYRPCALRDLDRIPVPVAAPPPAYPPDIAKSTGTREVTVEFYIDETGAVRMPFVVGRPSFPLAHFAVAAVRQWKFETPTCHGTPVMVRARQVFRFNPDAPAKK